MSTVSLARRFRVAAVMLLAILGVPTGVATAQSGGVPPECVIDSSSALHLDTLTFTLAALRPGEQDSTAIAMAKAIAESYRHPPGAPLILDGWTGALTEFQRADSVWKKRGMAGPRHGVLKLTFDSSGRLDDTQVLETSQSLTVDHALLQAVHQADSSGRFAALADLPGKTFQFRVSQGYGEVGVGVPFFQTDVRYLLITKMATLAKAFQPRYPEAAQAMAIEAHVDTRFIVGVDGRAEPASLQLIGGSEPLYREFVAAARDAVLNSIYNPAKVQGCPVRQLVRQRISFKF